MIPIVSWSSEREVENLIGWCKTSWYPRVHKRLRREINDEETWPDTYDNDHFILLELDSSRCEARRLRSGGFIISEEQQKYRSQ
jgi:hypothetical protein